MLMQSVFFSEVLRNILQGDRNAMYCPNAKNLREVSYLKYFGPKTSLSNLKLVISGF